MKVIAIIGSPRKNGNSEILASHTLKAIAEEGIDTEIVRLAGLDIRPCNACMTCAKQERCSIEDDMFPIYLKMKEADGIIIASPVYFHAVTGLLRAFMERAGYIARWNGEPFSRKVGGPMVVARRAGHNSTLAEMLFWFLTMGIVVPGSTYLNIAFGREKGEVVKDEEGIKTAWNFGKNVAWALQKLKSPC
jgi:multimeric flavodoxin WrbA